MGASPYRTVGERDAFLETPLPPAPKAPLVEGKNDDELAAIALDNSASVLTRVS